MRNKILSAVGVAAIIALMPAPASADPDEATLEADLAAAIEAVAVAEDEVKASKARADELALQVEATQAELDTMAVALNEYAVYLYTEGDLQSTNAVLSADDPQEMVDALTYTGFLAGERADLLADTAALLEQREAEQAALADEIAAAEQALDDAEKAADDLDEQLEDLRAEQAAGPVGDGGAPAPGGYNGSGSEGCTEDDPTTSGCVTPRTLHVYNETIEAGFDHHVSCYRPSGSGEHPKGRACDWAADESGFANEDAQGSDKTYGDELAAWYVNNADSLGIEYVIWYREFWSPSSGWRTYSGANGDPSSDHTNHVHVSIR